MNKKRSYFIWPVGDVWYVLEFVDRSVLKTPPLAGPFATTKEARVWAEDWLHNGA